MRQQTDSGLRGCKAGPLGPGPQESSLLDEGLNRHFSKKADRWPSRHTKEEVTWLIIEMQIKLQISPPTSQDGQHQEVYKQ